MQSRGPWALKLLSAGIWMGVFQLTSKLCLLGATAVAARTLSHSQFGIFFALQGAAVVIAAVFDLGTSTLTGRELAAGDLTVTVFRRSLMLRVKVVVPAAGLSIAGLAVFRPNVNLLEISSFILGAAAINASMLLLAILEGALNYRAAALCQSSGRIVFLALTIIGSIADRGSVAVLAAAFAIGEATTLLTSAFAMIIGRSTARLTSDAGGKGRWMKASLSYWLNSVFNLIYNRADIAIVTLLAGSIQGSLYAPASTIQNALLVLPGLVTAGLPNIGAAVYERGVGRDRLLRTFRVSLITAVVIGIGVAAIATAFTPELVGLIGGPSYHGAYVPTILLAWSTPFFAAQMTLICLLIAMGRGPATTAVYGTALVSALIAHGILTPAFGAVGGAWASLLREPPTLLVAGVVASRALRVTGEPRSP